MNAQRNTKGKNLHSTEFRPRNILDSTAPEPRGKERLVPKQKKPKTFRQKINYEKETLKTTSDQQQSEPEETPNEPEASDSRDQLHSNSVDSDDLTPDEPCKRDEIDQSLLTSFSKLNLKSDLDVLIETILHPPCHREYALQALTGQIELKTYTILVNLIRFQDRVHHKNPDKLQIKRRYVSGFNQVNKSVRLNKAKAVIIAPDVQRIIKDGILDQTVNNLIISCSDKSIPIIFTSTRNRLAKVCCKNPRSHLSCIAILDYSGTQDDFHELMNLIEDAKQIYQNTRVSLKKHLGKSTEQELIGISEFLVKNNQLPGDLKGFRETINSPLYRNVYTYIKQIKSQKK